ncbi:MAG: hypothetical protein ACM3SX_03625 [Deltaproteobacteria bacterium]
MRRSGLSELVVVRAILVGAAPVIAQRAPDQPALERFDVALGITMNGPADVNQPPKCTELGLPCLSPRTFPDFGLAAQGVVHTTRYLAVAAEASLYNNSWDSAGVTKALINHVSSVLLGPRLTTGFRDLGIRNDTTRLDVFAQILGGPEASTVLPTRFALQPGAGMDGKLSPKALSARVTYDYRLTRGSPRNLSGGRFLLALALAIP